MVVLILFVSIKFQGSFQDLFLRAAAVRENRLSGSLNANFVPFSTIRIYYRLRNQNPVYVRNLIGNVIPFLPMGYSEAFFCFHKRNKLFGIKAMLICLFMIVFIEVVQLITGLGYFDVDDILLNLLGCLLGLGFFLLYQNGWGKHNALLGLLPCAPRGS